MTASVPLLIQQMLQPGFYPHTVMEPIQLIQTHISYVLLTGDYVYKVKKPVNFGFLDSSLHRNFASLHRNFASLHVCNSHQ